MEIINYMSRCILFCAGEFDIKNIDHDICSDSTVIAVDGGVGYCRRLNIRPDIIIGDLDSASDDDVRFIEESDSSLIRLPHEKDDTDTIAAIKKGLELGCNEFLLYCAAGGRIDHYFANIQALMYIKYHGAEGRIIGSDTEIFIIENQTVILEAREKGTVSLFAMGDRAEGVTIKGLYYQVENAVITNDFPIGISNEFCGNRAKISVVNGALVCMIGRTY